MGTEGREVQGHEGRETETEGKKCAIMYGRNIIK